MVDRETILLTNVYTESTSLFAILGSDLVSVRYFALLANLLLIQKIWVKIRSDPKRASREVLSVEK